VFWFCVCVFLQRVVFEFEIELSVGGFGTLFFSSLAQQDHKNEIASRNSSFQEPYIDIKMTAARAGSPLCSPFRVKNARVTDSDGLISCGRTADFLVKTAAAALRLDVQSEAKRMCVTEWGKRGGLDGTLICALCDFTPITYRAENFPRHGSCRSGDGCYSCNLDFYTSRVCERTGKTVTLCEFCYEGEWTRFGRRAFEVVRPVKLFLVDCAESLVWGYEAFGGHMLRDALRQGIEMVRYRVPWDSLVDESLENELRGLVLEGAFSDAFDAPCRRRLREEGGCVGKSRGSGVGLV